MQHGSRSRNLRNPGVPRTIFLTRSTARGDNAAILEGRLFVFFVLVGNHYFTIMLFFWSSSTYNTHINKSVQDSHNKTLVFRAPPISIQTWGSLVSEASQSAFTNCFTICLKIFAIQTRKQSLVKSCCLWVKEEQEKLTGQEGQLRLDKLDNTA